MSPAKEAYDWSYEELLTLGQALFDAIPTALYVCAGDGTIARFNRRAVELWGREPAFGDSEERFCGAHRLIDLDGTLIPHHESPMALALRSGKPVRDREIIVERANGSQAFVMVNIRPFVNAHGEVEGAINCFQEITRHKTAEAAQHAASSRLDALNRIAKMLSSDLDLERIVQLVTDSAKELSGAKFGAFFYNVTDPDGERYMLYTLSGAPREAFEEYGIPRKTAMFDPTFRGLGVIRADDVRQDHRYGRNPPHFGMPKGHLPVVSYLAVPVISRSGDVIGGLFFGHDRPGVFTKESEEVVLGIASHAAIAIDNAQLLQGAKREIDQRRRAEEALSQRGIEQSALHDLTARLLRAKTDEDIYDAAMDTITRVLQCRRASILLFDESGFMRFVASRGLSENYIQAVEGHSPWTPQSKDPEPICIEDLEKSELSPSLKATIEHEGIGALAFIPLLGSGRVIGKFMAYYDRPHDFSDLERDLALTVARQLGFAIERKRGEDALRARESELELVFNRTPFMLTRCSRDLRYLTVSHAYAAMLNRKPDDVAGKPIVEIMGRDGFAAIRPHVERVLRGERVEYEAQVPLLGIAPRFLRVVYQPERDGKGDVSGWVASILDITEHKRAEAQRADMLAELNHRVKNSLSTVVSIARQSLADSADLPRARRAFNDRVRAFAQVHGRLAEANWSALSLETVMRDEMAFFGIDERASVQCGGPPVRLNPKCALTLGLAVHELVSNSTRHGSLSNERGKLDVTWQLEDNGLSICWRESQGPKVERPHRIGFGLSLLERGLPSDLDACVKIEFDEEGFRCDITLPSSSNLAGTT
jgi:PAS domain S-box-containing protein